MEKLNIAITGASGMVGGIILNLAQKDDRIGQIVSFVRKPTGNNHPKLKEVVVHDFGAVESFKSHLENINIVYYCIGVYTGAVPKDLFTKITVDYPYLFGQTLKEVSPNAKFCLLSGQGADRTESSRILFARDKGVVENKLAALNFKAFHTFRPGYIYPVEKREEPNFSYRLMRRLYPLIKLFGPKASIQSTELAQCMFEVGIKNSNKEIWENKDMIEFLKE